MSNRTSKTFGREFTRRGFISKVGQGMLAANFAGVLAKGAQAELVVPEPPGKKLGWAIVGLGSLAINQILPASFYLPGKPVFFSTPFGAVTWPPIGPDVLTGTITNVGGHASKNPAQLCYENTSKTNGVLNFNANNCYSSTSISAPKNLRIVP